MIFISSVAFGNIDLIELIDIVNENKYNVELSANINHDANYKKQLKKIESKFLIHNYFPRPNKDFVINLASKDENIRRFSIQHCVDNINLCDEFNIKYYSIHAGFRFDPQPELLGNKFRNQPIISRQEAIELFAGSLNEIFIKTGKKNVLLLIENNVITKENIMVFGVNPLLCCDGNDFLEVFKIVNNDRLGALIDFGHAKINALTTGIKLTSIYERLSDKIHLHHLSENDGITDSNKPFYNNEGLKKIKKYLFKSDLVLEIKNIDKIQINEQITFIMELLNECEDSN